MATSILDQPRNIPYSVSLGAGPPYMSIGGPISGGDAVPVLPVTALLGVHEGARTDANHEQIDLKLRWHGISSAMWASEVLSWESSTMSTTPFEVCIRPKGDLQSSYKTQIRVPHVVSLRRRVQRWVSIL